MSGDPVIVTLLDRTGVIVAVNQEWQKFCLENGGDPARCGVGISYLDVCDRAGEDTADDVAECIRAALLGDVLAPLTVRIPCDGPAQPRWFDVLISSRLDDSGQCIGATVMLAPVRAATAAPPPVTLPTQLSGGFAKTDGQVRKDREIGRTVAEDDRIAADLHDHIVQEIFAIGMSLSSVMSRISDPSIRGRVSACVDDLDRAIRHLRDTIFRLESRRVDSLSRRLLAVVDQQNAALGFSADHDIDRAVDGVATGALADDVLAVTREALSNIARHAHATAAQVRVGYREGLLTVEATDNGHGVGTSVRSSGLSNMRRRARTHGGEFTLSAPAAGGTHLRWSAPA